LNDHDLNSPKLSMQILDSKFNSAEKIDEEDKFLLKYSNVFVVQNDYKYRNLKV